MRGRRTPHFSAYITVEKHGRVAGKLRIDARDRRLEQHHQANTKSVSYLTAAISRGWCQPSLSRFAYAPNRVAYPPLARGEVSGTRGISGMMLSDGVIRLSRITQTVGNIFSACLVNVLAGGWLAPQRRARHHAAWKAPARADVGLQRPNGAFPPMASHSW
jgi:hypothetical protein